MCHIGNMAAIRHMKCVTELGHEFMMMLLLKKCATATIFANLHFRDLLSCSHFLVASHPHVYLWQLP